MFFIVLLWLSSVKIQQTSCQFAPHMDFQKIDEIPWGDTKYKVLRPAVHITKDHFKDFIQNRDRTNFPGRKILVDKNGFRHYWSGFEDSKHISLRKDLLQSNDNKIASKVFEGINKINSDKLNQNKDKEIVNDKTEVTKKVKKKPNRKNRFTESTTKTTTSTDNNKILREVDNRTRVRTTFFCPFFGLITMISYID